MLTELYGLIFECYWFTEHGFRPAGANQSLGLSRKTQSPENINCPLWAWATTAQLIPWQPIPVSCLDPVYSVQFSSVTQSSPTLCDPMNHSMPGYPVHHQLPEFTQTHVHRVSDAIQSSHPLSPFSSWPQSLPASGSLPMSQLFS